MAELGSRRVGPGRWLGGGEPGWQEWVRGWGPGAMGCCGAGVLGRVGAEMRGCRGDGAR